MDLLQAIILGVVQGLTEFIPISSTAHLVFASRFTNLYNGNAEQITATIAVIQLGTLAAVLFILLPILGHYNGVRSRSFCAADRPARDAVLRDRRRAADLALGRSLARLADNHWLDTDRVIGFYLRILSRARALKIFG